MMEYGEKNFHMKFDVSIRLNWLIDVDRLISIDSLISSDLMISLVNHNM